MLEGSEVSPSSEKPLPKDLFHRLIFGLKMAELQLSRPDQCRRMRTAASVYDQIASSPEWTVPEDVDSGVARDLHLLKLLEPINLTPLTGSGQKALKAMMTLYYCSSPAEMARRIGEPAIEYQLREISKRCSDAVDSTVGDLRHIGYGETTESPRKTSVFSPIETGPRPYVIYVTPGDIKKIHGPNTAGIADPRSQAAFVAVDRQQDVVTYSPVKGLTRVEVVGRIYATTLHELSHIIRQTKGDGSYYVSLQKRDPRLSQNLDEGSTEMLAMRAAGKLSPGWNTGSLRPQKYTQAADIIHSSLVPQLVESVTSARPEFTDLSDLPPGQDLDQVLAARFMLGDYELLDRLTRDYAMERTKNKGRFTSGIWVWAVRLLEQPDVFGRQSKLNDYFLSQKEDGDNIPVGDGQPIPPGVWYDDYNSNPFQFKPEYRYQVRNPSGKWQNTSFDSIRYLPDMELRINFLRVYSDSTEAAPPS